MKNRGIIYITVGLIPYIITLIYVFYNAIFGISDCLIDLGPETNCKIVYGIKSIKYSFENIFILCWLYFYICIPLIIISIILIIIGIKKRK